MEIRLGRRSDYAIRAMLYLARHAAEHRAKSREVAEVMDVPARFLNHIMAALVRAGLVTSTAGPAGGYQLTLEPGDVSVLDVVHAVDGDIRATTCPLRGGPCHWVDSCALHDDWAAAQQAMLDRLAATDLASLAVRDAELEAAAPATPVEGAAAAGPAGGDDATVTS